MKVNVSFLVLSLGFHTFFQQFPIFSVESREKENRWDKELKMISCFILLFESTAGFYYSNLMNVPLSLSPLI